MSQPVQRLSDTHRAELLRLYRDLARLQPDIALFVAASDVIEALQVEDYRTLHDCGVFIQDGVFPSDDDSGADAHPGVVFLPGVFPWVESGCLDLVASNDSVFAMA